MRSSNTDSAIVPSDVPVFDEAPQQEQIVTTIDGLSSEEMNALYRPFALSQYEQHAFHKYWYVKEEAINRRLTKVFGTTGWSFHIQEHEIFAPSEPTVKQGSVYIPLSQFVIEPLVEIKHVPQGDAETSFEPEPMLLTAARTQFKEELRFGSAVLIPYEETEWERRARISKIKNTEIVYSEGYCIVTGSLQCGDSIRSGLGGSEMGNLGKGDVRLINSIKAAYTDVFKRLARLYGIGLDLTSLPKTVESAEQLKKWLAERYPNDPRYMDRNGAGKRMVEDLVAAVPERYSGDIKANLEMVKSDMNALKLPEGNWFIDNYDDCLATLVAFAKRQSAA